MYMQFFTVKTSQLVIRKYIKSLFLFLYAGSQVGTIISYPLSGWLCANGFAGGWPSVFYVFGNYIVYYTSQGSTCSSSRELQLYHMTMVYFSEYHAMGNHTLCFKTHLFCDTVILSYHFKVHWVSCGFLLGCIVRMIRPENIQQYRRRNLTISSQLLAKSKTICHRKNRYAV